MIGKSVFTYFVYHVLIRLGPCPGWCPNLVYKWSFNWPLLCQIVMIFVLGIRVGVRQCNYKSLGLRLLLNFLIQQIMFTHSSSQSTK